MSRTHELLKHGQSLWLDYIDRGLLVRDGLKHLIGAGIRGVTSNPTIFNKAITGSRDYDESIRELIEADHLIDGKGLYHWLTLQDAQMAADQLLCVYQSSKGLDGYISLEVAPDLAYDTAATINAARHLWREVNRPNLMIKVPSTEPGLPAMEQLIAEGINVNATLLFSVKRYREVAHAYLRGLARAGHPERVASVASFFVSRVDTKVDKALAGIDTTRAIALQGRIAVANAQMAYQTYLELLKSSEWKALAQRGARMQRTLWASTGTKNPNYSKLLYVEQLIGQDTVNTVPPETFDIFMTRGEVRETLTQNVDVARRQLRELSELGIDLEEITRQLEKEGVDSFADSYFSLIEGLKQKCAEVTKTFAG